VALVGGGLLWLLQATGLGLPEAVFWPAVIFSVGLMLVWWQADHISNRAIRATPTRVQWVAPLLAHWSTVVSFGVGLSASGVAIALVAVAQPGLGEVARLFLVLGLSVATLLLAAAPWIIRVRRSLAAARQEKMIADTRADMAAHLHDSVLQTLALIQRQAGDPRAVAGLARRQERELRAWLYGETAAEATLKVALTGVAADVEDVHDVPVELVLVGDTELTTELTALVAAAREAMVNAAKHSEAAKVDVYAEVEDAVVEVFVRDRGVGFDPDSIPADRLGVRGSIVERLRRVGGNATIRSIAGEGTEVRLEVRR
ncbi:MAG: ATP-binding protein, partial [Micropruina sp.]